MRGANHNFIFTNDSKKPDAHGNYRIHVQYKYKKIKKGRVTPVRIPSQSWDKANNWIKGSHEKKLEQEREALNRLKDRFKHVRYSMAEGKMTIDEGFNYILNKTNDQELSDFLKKLKPNKKRGISTLRKHKQNLSAIESHFKRLKYYNLKDLTFVHLNSLDTVKEISRVLDEEADLKPNTVSGYLKTLDLMTKLNGSPLSKPFASNQLIPTEQAGDNTPVFYAEIMNGLNRVNTLHQFTGFMWWLYSFCLMGMDGIDIANISEDNLCDPIDPTPINPHDEEEKKLLEEIDLEKYREPTPEERAEAKARWEEAVKNGFEPSMSVNSPDGMKYTGVISEEWSSEPIDKGNFMDGIEDYFPNARMQYNNHFNKRNHIEIKRGKSGIPFVMTINLFPTLMIRDILHRLIKITQPEIAYTGKDRLKLFNFEVRDKNNNLIPSGEAKWETIRKKWSDSQRKCFGFTTQQTRHTVTRTAQDLGASKIDLNAQLGHKEQSVMRHYLSEDQTRLDILQTHIIQDFGVLDIMGVILEDFCKRYELVNNYEFPYIIEKHLLQFIYIGDNLDDNKKRNEGLYDLFFQKGFNSASVKLRENTIKSGELTPFTRADEWKFEKLYRRESERNFKSIDGKRVQVVPDLFQLSPDLQELIKKRFETVNPDGSFDALELGEKYL